MLDAQLHTELGSFTLDAALSVEAGEVVALLGPSGSGKSTVLRTLSGLLPLTGGKVVLDDIVLDDPANGIRVKTERRPVSMMFQDYLLFPYLSALENTAFGLRARGMERQEARAKARDALDLLGVAHLASSRPRQMSGGQQQRVAMARAIVTEPRLLLLDEPLAALDVATRAEIRRYLRSMLHQTRAASVLVTHDLLDAVAVADRLVVMEDGHIVQSGTPVEVTTRPRSPFVAQVVNINLVSGVAHASSLEADGGGRLAVETDLTGDVLAVIQPDTISVSRDRPEGAGPNVWSGKIGAIDLLPDEVRVEVQGAPTVSAVIPRAALEELQLDDGGELWVSVDPSDITVYRP